MPGQNKYKDSAVLFGVFAFGIALHLLLYFTVFDFARAIRLSHDETVYYDLARSMFNGWGLEVRGLPTTYQKLGYPLLIMPLFAISDVALRLKAIGVTNIIVMNTTVIFVWMICSELGLSRRAKYCTAFFTAIWPDMMYSMGYMSEVLYWPLSTIMFWLWLVNERRQSYILAVISGAACYFTYLTKEVALAFPLAYLAFEAVYPVLSFMLDGNSQSKPLRDFFSKKRFLLLVAALVTFAVCYVVMKSTLFYGMGNTYNQQGIEAIMSPYKFMYMLYAFFYYIAALLMASLVIPLVMPAINFRSMNDFGRKLFCYVVLFGVIMSATIAYTISVRESLGHITPSIHLRYYGTFFIVLLALFFSSMQNVTSEDISGNRRYTAEVLTLAVMYACFVFRGIISTSSADQYILLWYMAIDKLAGPLFPPVDKWEVIYPSAIIAGVLVAVLAMMFYSVYTRRGKVSAQRFFAGVLLAATIGLNFAAGTVIDYAYHVDAGTVNEVVRINRYFAGDDSSNVLYLNYGRPKDRYDYFNRYVDTYMERRHHFYVVRDEDLTETINGNSINVENITLKTDLRSHFLTNVYEDIHGIDYIMLENSNSAGQRKLANVERVEELCGEHFTVYRNLDPSVIQFE